MAIDVVLPDPLTPTTITTVGPVAAHWMGDSACRVRSRTLSRIRSQDVLHMHDAATKLAGDLLADGVGRFDAHIGSNQDGEQAVEEGVVKQFTLPFEKVAYIRVQDLCGLLEPLP